ncbi:MAG: Rdx family protein [Roseibacillus sp.]|nr:Rdx family protein [Roseibacillus sp.]
MSLVAGGGGIFEVRRDGELLYTKARTGGFPKRGEAASLF